MRKEFDLRFSSISDCRCGFLRFVSSFVWLGTRGARRSGGAWLERKQNQRQVEKLA
ncbi:MAG: hypothetical protein NZ805_10500 [Armatimonadetes bacterium]|nr:hypothetical protein [Armatimonadota bacterium]MDW8026998.1 hypothetical protein [Armatimonadota bacterium]